jgi:hypothetical protein
VVRIAYDKVRNQRSLLITQYWLLIIFTLPVLLSAVPLLYPRLCPGPLALSMADVFAYERATGHTGVDPLGAYLPVTVVERPSGSPLEAQYAAGESIKRLDRSVLPEGAQIVSEAYQPNRAEIVLDSPIDFQATYLAFAFPGWQATIAGQEVPIVPSDPNGLITFEVPAGRQTITVAFEDTPSRTLANVISLAALMVFAGVLVRGVPRDGRDARDGRDGRDGRDARDGRDGRDARDGRDGRDARGMNPAAGNGKPDKSGSAFILHPSSFLLVPVVFLLLKLLLIDPQLTPLRQAQLQNGVLQNVEHPTQIDYGDQLRLLGYSVSPGSAPSGETVRVDLYWRVLRPLDKQYQTTVGVIDASGEVWSPKTLDRPRDYQDYPATTTWPLDAYVVDSFELPINPGTPPGDYQIFAEVFERGSQLTLPAQAMASRSTSRPAAALIGPLVVTRAQRTFSADELGIYNLHVDQPLTPEIKLLGANRDRDAVLSGETVLLTLFWQAMGKPAQDYGATIELVDDQNQVVLTRDFPLGNGRYPASQWNTDEQIVNLDRVRVPAGLASGSYRWRVSIGNSEPIELGEVRVTAPERSFAEPAIAQRIDQTLGDQAALLGYDLAGCKLQNAECRVKLWWRAEQDIPESYKVFVQLLDANGVPRAQADVIPQNGTRPTWSWLPGEIVGDEIVLKIPADLPIGAYRLTAGLYDELTGKRLTLPAGNDLVELIAIEIEP